MTIDSYWNLIQLICSAETDGELDRIAKYATVEKDRFSEGQWERILQVGRAQREKLKGEGIQ